MDMNIYAGENGTTLHKGTIFQNGILGAIGQSKVRPANLLVIFHLSFESEIEKGNQKAGGQNQFSNGGFGKQIGPLLRDKGAHRILSDPTLN